MTVSDCMILNCLPDRRTNRMIHLNLIRLHSLMGYILQNEILALDFSI